MGLLKHLLFWPVTGPLFLTDFALDKVTGVVRDELTDDSQIKEELLDLQLRLELGEITEAEYARGEAELMARLRDVRQWREQFGMGVAGGPVRVQGGAEEAPAPSDRPPVIASPVQVVVEVDPELIRPDQEEGPEPS